MNESIHVICRDTALIAELRQWFAGQFELVVCEMPETGDEMITKPAAQAVLFHLTPDLADFGSAEQQFSNLQQMAGTSPILGLIEPGCSKSLINTASEVIDELLPLPLERDRLEQLIAHRHDPIAELGGLCSGLVHKELHGRTRSLITFTPELFDTLDELKVAAAHDVTVLLIGETGSGKTYLARLIHELSSRHEEQIYTVACGALPPNLIESELFGHVKGAFTGADRDKPGKFSAAGRGTLLLDEIDVLPLEQQTKLLRVIETGEYEPVGSNEIHQSQARLVVASNRELEDLVKEGLFRSDLYYRLNILKFNMPALRERPQDIEYLARHFAHLHSRKHNIQLRGIDQRFLEVLCQYDWPGNIRELENVVHRAVLYCRRAILSAGDLPSALRPAADDCVESPQSMEQNITLESRVGVAEQRIIADSLRRNSQHRQATASELGISRVTLYNKMKKFGMLN